MHWYHKRAIVAGFFCIAGVGSAAPIVQITGTLFHSGHGTDVGITGESLSLGWYKNPRGFGLGLCTLGTTCNIDFTVDAAPTDFHSSSGGIVNDVVAYSLSGGLRVTGQAVIPPTIDAALNLGIVLPVNISGQITGFSCSRPDCFEGVGPRVFIVQIVATGTLTLLEGNINPPHLDITAASGTFAGTATATVVPEPSTMTLFGIGFLGLICSVGHRSVRFSRR